MSKEKVICTRTEDELVQIWEEEVKDNYNNVQAINYPSFKIAEGIRRRVPRKLNLSELDGEF